MYGSETVFFITKDMKNRLRFVLTMAKVLTLSDVDIAGKTVLLRVDINSPMDPQTKEFLDVTRIRAIVPTMNKLKGAKVVILAHQSRRGKFDFTSTLGHARELGRLLGRKVQWVNDIHGERAMQAIEQMSNGDILMLNNVRMDDDELLKGDMNTLGDTNMVQHLASIADVFVNDAFACAHRGSASIVGFTSHIPCVAGVLMGKEIKKLDQALEQPVRPCLAVLGGVKIDDSIEVAQNMLRNKIADEIWATGGVANVFFHAKGIDIGKENIDFLIKAAEGAWEHVVDIATSLLANFSEKIRLPIDVAVNVENNRVDIPLDKLPFDAPIHDLGIKSIFEISTAIKQAGTVILNGPAGVFENSDFALGTYEILNACAESNAYTVVGGGHTATLVSKRKLAHKMGHVSTGGGACLDYIAGRALPGVVSLESSATLFSMELTKVSKKE